MKRGVVRRDPVESELREGPTGCRDGDGSDDVRRAGFVSRR